MPKHNKYVWQTLNALARDAEMDAVFANSQELQAVVKDLKQIVRNKDILAYDRFCDKNSLVEINKDVNIMGLNYEDESSIRIVRWRRLFTCFQKYDFFGSPFDKRAAAYDTFKKYEKQCKATNQLEIFDFETRPDGKWQDIDEIFTIPVFEYARDFIHRLLGLHINYDEFLRATRHGPGATSTKRGDSAIPIAKFFPPFDVTPGAKDLFISALMTDERWRRCLHDFACKKRQVINLEPPAEIEELYFYLDVESLVTKCDSSRILFVPKTSKTERTIAAEPTANIYLQLSVDTFIRKRLKKFGIDIDTQEKNQDLAYHGSINGSLVTIDLSGASDTIALSWLKLFPEDWAQLLIALRTPKGTIHHTGEEIVFNKLSAMGNGFTFAVETLIFASLLFGLVKYRGEKWNDVIDSISIYGDDIICPVRFYSDYAFLLKRAGFSINAQKSFSTGSVRESCGSDFVAGHLITRPAFKNLPRRDWELIRDHNRFYRLKGLWDFDLTNTCNYIRHFVDQKHQVFGPVDDDRLISWFFSTTPLTPNGKVLPRNVVTENMDWQVPVYVIKSYDLQYKPMKKSARLQNLKFFEPMMFLRSGSSNVPDSLSFQRLSTIPLQPTSIYYSKKLKIPRTSKTYLPYYLWQHE
jgi:hypothetical protein